MALPVKYTVRGESPDVGEPEPDATTGVKGAVAVMIIESESWLPSLSVIVRIAV